MTDFTKTVEGYVNYFKNTGHYHTLEDELGSNVALAIAEMLRDDLTRLKAEVDRSWKQKIGNKKKTGYGSEVKEWNECLDDLIK